MITLKSTVRDLYNHPIGHDIMDTLLSRSKWPKLATSPIIRRILGRLTLRTLKRLKGKENLIDALIALLNTEFDILREDSIAPAPAWWKEAVFYRIDLEKTTGGLQGVIFILDYLQDMGINAVWLSPVCDGGHTVRDYYSIMPDYGKMDDMDSLISELRRRGMRLILDLSITHTSDDHPWFYNALANEDSPYRNYYFLRKSYDKPPNNWDSHTGGSAWNYYPKQNIWGLHLFSDKQMELNWDCEALRNDIYAMLRWWLNRGVNGFCLNSISFISKATGLPDGDLYIDGIAGMMNQVGIEHYFYGPQLHQHLRELRKNCFDPYDAFYAGEAPGIGTYGGRMLTDSYRNELDLILNNLVGGLVLGHADCISRLNADCGYGWNALGMALGMTMGMHETPCPKMSALLQCTLRGTPFIDLNENKTPIDENLLYFYRELIYLRQTEPALIYGALTFINNSNLLCYTRILTPTGNNFYIEANLTNRPNKSAAPENAVMVIGSCEHDSDGLRPYEARVYKI